MCNIVDNPRGIWLLVGVKDSESVNISLKEILVID
jgi:hypothetical protein